MIFKKIQAFFERVVDRVENNTTPFTSYLFLFIAILLVRLGLEFFSSKRLFTADDILHIGLWFTFIVLAFMVQLKLFSGERMLRVSRLVIVFFSIALTAPILDLLITNGVGAKMNYLSINSAEQFFWAYVTMGGSGFTRGATPGIRVEIILLLICSFNYVRTKRKSILWAIASVFSIYTILFLSGAIPLFLSMLNRLLHLSFGQQDESTVLLLLSVDLILVAAACVCHAPHRIRQYLKQMPAGILLIVLLLALLGFQLSHVYYPQNFEWNSGSIFRVPLFLILIVAFSFYAGTISRSMPEQSFQKEVSILKYIFPLVLFFTAAMISTRVFFTVALCWALLYLLYERPLRLSTVPLLSPLLWAMLLLSVALTGFAFGNAPMIGFPAVWIWIILGASFAMALLVTERQKTSGVRKMMLLSIAMVLWTAVFVYGFYFLPGSVTGRTAWLLCGSLPLIVSGNKKISYQKIILACIPASLLLYLFSRSL